MRKYTSAMNRVEGFKRRNPSGKIRAEGLGWGSIEIEAKGSKQKDSSGGIQAEES